MDVNERLDFLEFRQELLFEDTSINRLLFETRVTKDQYNAIMDLFDKYRNKIDNREDVNHNVYESEIYQIVPQCNNSYHFAESVAQCLHENDRWTEVFETLYGHLDKFQSYLNRQNA